MSRSALLIVTLLNLDGQQGELLEVAVGIGCSLGAFVFLILPGVFKSTFGKKEFLTTAFVCEIAADSNSRYRGIPGRRHTVAFEVGSKLATSAWNL